jgi:hypothetical protein
MTYRRWVLAIIVVMLGLMSGTAAVRAVDVGAYCTAYQLPKECKPTADARCNRLSCYLRRGGTNVEAQQEYLTLGCWKPEFEMCLYSGPTKRGVRDQTPLPPDPKKGGTSRHPGCHPSYSLCIMRDGRDVDCNRRPDEIPRADGPRWVWGEFTRFKDEDGDLMPDDYNLDGDNDGKACELQLR